MPISLKVAPKQRLCIFFLSIYNLEEGLWMKDSLLPRLGKHSLLWLHHFGRTQKATTHRWLQWLRRNGLSARLVFPPLKPPLLCPGEEAHIQTEGLFLACCVGVEMPSFLSVDVLKITTSTHTAQKLLPRWAGNSGRCFPS